MKLPFKKRYLLVFPIMVLLMMTYIIIFFGTMAYGHPYGKNSLSKNSIPTFTKSELAFTHTYTKSNSLPIQGSAIIDINNDSIPELFLAGGYEQKDVLLAYRSDTVFVDVTKEYFLKKSTVAATYGALVLDVDNDDLSDLFVARDDGIYLYKNVDGKSLREEKLAIKFRDSDAPVSLTSADLNRDGLPDLFVSTYLKKSAQEGMSIFNKVGYGAESVLLLNNGDNTFTDITASAGLTYKHNTFQSLFTDLDGDKDQDLVVAYDTGTVKTWRNNGDMTFTDMPNPTTNEFAYPMGIAAGDYNNDGKTDLAFSNVGDMGLMTFVVRGDLKNDQILNDQLIFLRNNGDFDFTNVAKEMKIGDYEFSWGLLFADFNNDAKEDLVMSQNFISLPPYKFFKAPSRLLLQGENGFESVESEAGTVNRKYGISPLFADFNRDGQLDLVFANLDSSPVVFINNGNKNPYFGVTLPDTVASTDARVVVESDNGVFSKSLIKPQGLASDSTHTVLLALPGASILKKVTIEYTDGTSFVIRDAKLNSYYVVGK